MDGNRSQIMLARVDLRTLRFSPLWSSLIITVRYHRLFNKIFLITPLQCCCLRSTGEMTTNLNSSNRRYAVKCNPSLCNFNGI